jgi:hypothetical protein
MQLTTEATVAALNTLRLEGVPSLRSSAMNSTSHHIILESIPLLEAEYQKEYRAAIVGTISAVQPAAVTITSPLCDASALYEILGAVRNCNNLSTLSISLDNEDRVDDGSNIDLQVC